jgi:AraC-like DNA-binding protein
MSRGVPLIRAAALVPVIRWMTINGRPVEDRLQAADLAYLPLLAPEYPIPLFSAASFLREVARNEEPDFGCRIAFSISQLEIAMMGKVALGGRTPREALVRVAKALPYFSTDEHFAFSKPGDDVTLVRYFWSVKFDVETLHLIQQFVAALIGILCRMTGAGGHVLARIAMIPHPQSGFGHLHSWLKGPIEPAAGQTLDILIDNAILDRGFRFPGRDRRIAQRLAEMPPLQGDGSLAGSVRLVIAAMLEGDTPSAQRMAAAAGLSLRTLQRRLAEENTSFSDLLDEVRRTLALSRLTVNGESLSELSTSLGFARQSALTRAVRRWTGRPPSQIRTGGTE